MKSKSPLSLLIAGINWPPETFLKNLIQGLITAGIRVRVATSSQPDAAWLSLSNFDWLPLPKWSDPVPLRFWRAGQNLGRAALSPGSNLRPYLEASVDVSGFKRLELLQRWLPFSTQYWDVLYFPWNSGAIENLPLFDRAPTIVSCRGAQINVAPLNPERADIRDGLRKTFAEAAAVHCVSVAIRDEASKYGLDPARSVVIYPAVDQNFFFPNRRVEEKSDRFRLITTGAFIWRKGYEYLLLAIRNLLDRGIPAYLTIIGDGPERQRLLYTIHDLKLNEAVVLRGRQSPEQVRQQLQESDVFVLSSLSEGVSNAVLEAMACGLPVVTTAVGGMGEAVTDGIEGYLIPPRDAVAIADALIRLQQDPVNRNHMGAAARTRIQRDFYLDKQVDAFVDLFRSVV
jgi:colanic acid/amylovoran biosynthesis glycosyltransferase